MIAATPRCETPCPLCLGGYVFVTIGSKECCPISTAHTSNARAVASPREWPQVFRIGTASRVRTFAIPAVWLLAGLMIIRHGAFLPGALMVIAAYATYRTAIGKCAAYVVTPDVLEIRRPDGAKERHRLANATFDRRTGPRGKRTAALTSPDGILLLDERDPAMHELAATLDALVHHRAVPNSNTTKQRVPSALRPYLTPHIWIPIALIIAWYIYTKWR